VSAGAICIPKWYHVGVSTQIAVRLADEIVTFVDAEVAAGRAPSRAAVVARALERERRLQLAYADVEILKRVHDADDLDDLAEYAAGLPIDLD
jgi:Arc/MetJ-type ribon-helix-helix transcriptional regulator